MKLGTLKNLLSKQPTDRVCQYGFSNPHSYRGYYEQVAFEPANYVTIGEMLSCVDYALTGTFEGYKGGEYHYDESTPVNIAYYGSCSEDELEVDIILSIAGAKE